MTGLHSNETARLPILTGKFVLAVTLGMTFLTFAKELVMFQNDRHHWIYVIYLVATRLYYPLLLLNLAMLLGLAIFYLKHCHPVRLLAITCAVFALNVALFSANNIVNFVRGKPLHRMHHGIGW